MTGLKGVLGVVMATVGLLVIGVGAAWGDSCANAEFRTGLSVGLPDCRAYEMVSPLEKGDSGVAFSDSRAASSGEAVTYMSNGAFAGNGPEPKGEALTSRYISRRGTGGWSTQNISPPNVTFLPQTFTPFFELLFTPDLSKGVLLDKYTPLITGELAGYFNLYVADTEAGSYQRVSDVTPPGVEPYEELGTGIEEPFVAGVSSDLSRIVFQQEASLTEGASPGHEHVYEWAGGALRQVDVAPPGTTFEGLDSVGARGREFVGADGWHAVSSDGSRVFFTAGERGSGYGLGQLYVRENPMSAAEDCAVQGDACTVEVSASQRVTGGGVPAPDPHGPKPAFYRGASADGSLVFFTSRAELTSEANTGPDDNAANLYAYDVGTGVLSDLTVDSNPGDVDGAAALGLVTASEDGSYVYFVANGVLASGAQPGDCHLEESYEAEGHELACSLYVEHYNGSAWEAPKFVATLAGGTGNNVSDYESNADEQDWVGYEGLTYYPFSLNFGPVQHTARVTPDGTHLVFQSIEQLTSYDNQPAVAGACGETGKCREMYLYNALTGKVVCASCAPSGAPPTGPAELGGQEEDRETAAFNQVSEFYLPRNLSEDGGRLFFQSPSALVSQDSNGVLDVYEWEQPVSQAEPGDSCTRSSADFSESDGGCVFAVSDVSGASESHFMDASPSGENVFIATAEQLVPADTDSRTDVYDVRVGGGFPAVSQAAAVCEEGESCRAPVPPAPVGVFGSPTSATFSGAGNVTVTPAPVAPAVRSNKLRPCAKGRVRERGKCVKQKRTKKRGKRAGKSSASVKRSEKRGK